MNGRSAGNGASFSNGGGPGDRTWPCAADWQAGSADQRLLWHWAAM